MSLFPTPTELIARARTDLRLGLPVVLRSDSATAFVLAAEGITEDRLASAREIGQPVLDVGTLDAQLVAHEHGEQCMGVDWGEGAGFHGMGL